MPINPLQTFNARGGWWVVIQFIFFAGIAFLLMQPNLLAKISGFPIWTGWIFISAGGIQGILGLQTLGRNLTPYPTPKHGSSLVKTGVYGLVRHPIYGALILGSAGLGIIDNNPAVLILTLIMTVFFRFKAGFEERALHQMFDDYAEYRLTTKWMIPFLF